MNGIDVEERLRVAVDHATPDVLDNIMSRCGDNRGKVVNFAPAARAKRTKRLVRFAAAAAAMLAIVLVGSFGTQKLPADNGDGTASGVPGSAAPAPLTVESVVYMDVNPSVKLGVSETNIVVTADALNEDAEGVMASLELEGKPLDEAAQELVGALAEGDYLTSAQNSVLISVDGSTPERSEGLEASLTASVSSAMGELGLTAAVLTQDVSGSETAQELSSELGVSEGKAALIEKMTGQIDGVTASSLADMTINELNVILDKLSISLEGVASVGEASSEAYVSAETATASAEAHAGVSDDGTASAGAQVSLFDGRLVYDVAFSVDGTNYVYSVDAETGDVLGWISEASGDVVSAGVSAAAGAAEDVANAVAGMVGASVDGARSIAQEYLSGKLSGDMTGILSWALKFLDAFGTETFSFFGMG